MADDIIARLRCAYRKGEEPPCEACTFCAARAEIEGLRAAGDVLAHLILPHAHLSVPCRSPQGTPLDEWCSECAALAAWQEACRG